MKKLFYFSLILPIAMMSCNPPSQKTGQSEAQGTTTDQFQNLATTAKPLFGTLPKIAENPANPITDQKVLLGQTLYFDKRLSEKTNISCNSCHDLSKYGVDNKPTSPGDEGEFGNRNSPTVLNAAFYFAQFWDGRAKDVEEQAGGPVLNPVEMGMPDQKFVIDRLSKIDGYKKLFAAAYPDIKDPVNYENIQKAIGAFERKLVTPSRFDEYLTGNESALNDQEKKGLQTFMNTGCTACHSGNVLGGMMYQKFGLSGNYWDLTKSAKIDNGRFDVTKNDADKYMFKVPSLRNIEMTYPYFHDGSVADLGEAVRIIAKAELNKDLTPAEIADIVAFLKSLTGKVPQDLATPPALPM